MGNRTKSYYVLEGIVHDTGWPIDGLRMRLSKWDYDPDDYHIWDWGSDQDEAVMKTFFQTETEAGICLYDSLEDFKKAWMSGEWEAQGAFCIPKDCVTECCRL